MLGFGGGSLNTDGLASRPFGMLPCYIRVWLPIRSTHASAMDLCLVENAPPPLLNVPLSVGRNSSDQGAGGEGSLVGAIILGPIHSG